MRIDRLLASKGDFVATVGPASPVRAALEELARYGIGALVVSPDGRHPQGVVSERDIVRWLNSVGPAVLDASVATIMSSGLHCCAPEDEVESIMATMTTHRVRHLPVLRDGELAGIVSIGDVVKSRMDELESERRLLVDYIQAR